MPDKKLTDSEIVKALECCISDKDDVCLECPLQNDCFANADGNSEVKELALDLINRLQADRDNYKQIAENQQKIILDKAFENKRLKEKVESLQAENERLKKVSDIRLECLGRSRAKAKAEAYKECIEKVKALFPSDNEPYQYCEIHEGADNILKELVGEDNG